MAIHGQAAVVRGLLVSLGPNTDRLDELCSLQIIGMDLSIIIIVIRSLSLARAQRHRPPPPLVFASLSSDIPT